MGFPSTGKEKLYRNDRDAVKKFLEQYHKDRYVVYNLCTERGYEESFFENSVERFPFEDHNPPPFNVLLPCCRSLDAFLSQDPMNIAAVHCKAGKGRTGVVICTYMVYLKLYKTALEALTVYGLIRTKDGKGVTINSQRRYIDYFAQCVNDDYNFPSIDATVTLKSVVLHGIPHLSKDGGSDPYFMIDSFKATHQKGSKNPTTLTTNIYDSRVCIFDVVASYNCRNFSRLLISKHQTNISSMMSISH
jgi:phosphatidylinositol-3,4,5-trisphosphate 3-phosphatase/dual-specificity protein phosphatase PTEN